MSIKLFIATPCSHEFVYRRFMQSHLNQVEGIQREFWEYGDRNNDWAMSGVNTHPNLVTNRNEFVYEAIMKRGATHILFLDSDIIIPQEGIKKLLMKNLPIAGLLCFTRNPENPEPILYKDGKTIDPYPEGNIEVDSTGTGCLMIQREVFVRIADLPEFAAQEGKFFVFKEAWNPDGSCKKLSEDRAFCTLARKAGFKIVVDTVNTCEHLTVVGCGIKQYKAAQSRKNLPLLVPVPAINPAQAATVPIAGGQNGVK